MKKAFTRDPDESKARKELLVAIAIICVVLLSVLLLPLAIRVFGSSDSNQSDPDQVALDTEFQATEFIWKEISGTQMPTSPVHGPKKAVNGATSDFLQTEIGAGLAATHYSFGISEVVPQTLSDAVFAESVVGDDKAALQTYVNASRKTDTQDILIAGWTVIRYTKDEATIRVAVFAEQSFIHAEINLIWQDDWKLVAPSNWVIGENITIDRIAPEQNLLESNPSLPAPESADGKPPTAEDFQPGTTLAAEGDVEEVLKQFGRAYFTEDYTVSYTNKAQSLKVFSTPALYIQILEDQPDNFETAQAKRFEETVTVLNEPEVSKIAGNTYQISAEIEKQSTNETTQQVNKQITVAVQQDSEAALVSEILVGP